MQQQSQLQIQMVKSSDSEGDAPPKQVAQALERLGEAGRLIGDVRLGADRILESIFSVASPPSTPGHNSKYINAIAHQESLVHMHLQNLLILGKQLEESGVLNDSLRSRSNSWGLHMPLVCPDGAVVAYAWKRQLAGQAGASAVDRTRLALKGFTDQKRRFFLHLADDDSAAEPEPKKQCIPPALNYLKEVVDQNTVASILSHLKKQNPHLQTFTYERLDWLKRASDLASATNESSIKSSRDHSFPNTSKLRQGSISVDAAEKAAVIELFVPSVFRAVVSLHTAGSINPNSVAYFSPDEGGSYLHAGGFSSHHVFRHVSEHACMALQYFVCIDPETALFSFLCWVCSYQTLFIKSCSKCGKLLAMDKQSGLVLPPVKRPFRYLSSTKTWLNKSPAEKRGLPAFHIGCYSD